jgi:crotonobetainyl-CoA:carnitine CoA-transferase CaiB-like acyl-CoA transferase
VGILSALRHRDLTGEGQHIDVALVDSQIAWLINEGVNYLTSGSVPERRGNGHPNIVPYDVYATRDGHVILAVGNDRQFARLSAFLGQPELAEDVRFATNPARLANRIALNEVLVPALAGLEMGAVIEGLEAQGVPVGPVQRLDQVFASEQVAAREMQIDMAAAPGPVKLIGNPLKFSRTPVRYRLAPPTFGADTAYVLSKDAPFDI